MTMPPSNVATPGPWYKNWNLSYLPDSYGPLYGGYAVQIATINTLQDWLPPYIYEVNRNLGGNILDVPKEYQLRPDYRALPPKFSCSVLVTVGRTTSVQRNSDGYRATWEMEAGLFIAGSKDWQETQAKAYAYGACVRGAIIANPGLGGFANGNASTIWTAESYLENDHVGGRTLGAIVETFQVTVNAANSAVGKPPFPSIAPPPPIPTVETTDTQVQNYPPGTVNLP